MNVLVVDDEPPARRRLCRLLSELPDVTVVGELADGEHLLERAVQCAADVILLDIRMPGLDGLSLAERYPQLPAIIFVTAYDEYAVRAFELAAVDYLLKPVRPERLASSLERIRARSQVEHVQPVSSSPPPMASHVQRVPRIAIKGQGELELFDVREVTRFWSSHGYTVFIADGAEHLSEEPLAMLEARLHEHGFLRVHRAELIRLDAVRSLRRDGVSYEALLSDAQSVRVSRRCMRAVKDALAQLTGSDRPPVGTP